MKAPGFGDRRKAMLGDIAVLTGGTLISEDLGLKLENLTLDNLAGPRRSPIDKDNCTIVEGGGKEADIKARIAQLKRQIETTDSDYDREKFQERLAKLSGGVAVVSVGGQHRGGNEADQGPRGRRPARHPCGGRRRNSARRRRGPAPLPWRPWRRSAAGRGDEKIGVDIVMRALQQPLRQIAENCGHRRLGGGRRSVSKSPRTPASMPTPASTSTCSRRASSIR